MKRIVICTLIIGLVLGSTTNNAHAIMNPNLPKIIAACAALKKAVEDADKAVRSCIDNCRRILEPTTPPDRLLRICGYNSPGGIDPIYPSESISPTGGLQCQAEIDAYWAARLAYARCFPAKTNPLLPKAGTADGGIGEF